MSVLTHFPKSRLSELFDRFGGLSREEAVDAATRELEVMRPESDKAIVSAVTQMEGIVLIGGDTLMKDLLPLCDQLVTLAGTFGYAALDKAARSLCDLIDGLQAREKEDLASIRVHIQTLRMLAPGGRPLSDAHTSVMLAELQRLLDFHGIVSPGDDQGTEDAFTAALR